MLSKTRTIIPSRNPLRATLEVESGTAKRMAGVDAVAVSDRSKAASDDLRATTIQISLVEFGRRRHTLIRRFYE
jgi:hypothetical protein